MTRQTKSDEAPEGSYPHQELGTAIAEAIKELGLNQSELADMLGISKQAVSDWTKGAKRPAPEHMRKLLIACSMRPDVTTRKPAAIEHVLATLETDLLEAMNRNLTAVPFGRINRANYSKVQVISSGLDSLEKATRSASMAHQYLREMTRRDPFVTARRSAACLRALQLLALSSIEDLQKLVDDLDGTWELTIVAPQLLLAAPDADSTNNIIRAVAARMLKCEGEECSRSGADVHAPDLFLLVFLARAAAERGYEEEFVESILDRLEASPDHLCVYHSGLVLEAQFRLCDELETRFIGHELLNYFSQSMGAGAIDVQFVPVGPERQLEIIARTAAKVRPCDPDDSSARYASLDGFLSSLEERWADRGQTDHHHEDVKQLVYDVEDHWHGVDYDTALLTAACVRSHLDMRLSSGDDEASDGTPSDAVANSLVDLMGSILDGDPAPRGQVLPSLAILDAVLARRPELAEAILQPLREQEIPAAALIVAAARWSSPTYRLCGPAFGRLDWNVLSGQVDDPDLIRVWVVGRELFASGRSDAPFPSNTDWA